MFLRREGTLSYQMDCLVSIQLMHWSLIVWIQAASYWHWDVMMLITAGVASATIAITVLARTAKVAACQRSKVSLTDEISNIYRYLCRLLKSSRSSCSRVGLLGLQLLLLILNVVEVFEVSDVGTNRVLLERLGRGYVRTHSASCCWSRWVMEGRTSWWCWRWRDLE